MAIPVAWYDSRIRVLFVPAFMDANFRSYRISIPSCATHARRQNSAMDNGDVHRYRYCVPSPDLQHHPAFFRSRCRISKLPEWHGGNTSGTSPDTPESQIHDP